MSGGFTWWGHALEYLDAEYNQTARNERAVEIPIAHHWLDRLGLSTRRRPRLLEVGNVLNHYGPAGGGRGAPTAGWTVLDRYARDDHGTIGAETDGVLAIDLFDHHPDDRYDAIVSISTIEHIRWDPPERRDPAGAIWALAHLEKLLDPDHGRMLVTVPLGYHPVLDAHLLAGTSATRACTLVRDPWGAPLPEGTWRQTDDLEHRAYDRTPWVGANAVWVGEWW